MKKNGLDAQPDEIEIIVTDDKGWGPKCPSYADVFFGELSGKYRYLPPYDGGHAIAGSLFVPASEVEAVIKKLNTTGDWEGHRPIYQIKE